MLDRETRLRLDAIQFVRSLRERWVAVPASELRRFRIHLKGQTGIFKPAELSEPLSITTTIDSERTQDTIEGSRVLYDYVSRDFDNEALKRCAEDELPLIYFLQVKKRPATEYVIFAMLDNLAKTILTYMPPPPEENKAAVIALAKAGYERYLRAVGMSLHNGSKAAWESLAGGEG